MGAPLTDVYIRSISPPDTGRIEITDERCAGLSIRVTAAGVRSWSYKYRDRTTGKVERVSLGRYPTVSLAKAREMADRRRLAVMDGGNPRAEQRKRKAAEKAAITFDALADAYLAERVAKKTPASLATTRSYLKAAREQWQGRKAKDIDRDDVIAFLGDRAEEAPVAANRLRSVLVTMYGWAMDNGHVEATPMVRIPKPAVETARDRIILDDEIPILWQALDGLDGGFARAFRALALLGQRPGEIAGLMLDEVHDLDKPAVARIELPPARTKNRRRHVIPLPGRARELIREAISAKPDGDDSPYVFGSYRNPGAPIDRHSFARAMARLVDGLDPNDGDDARRAAVKRLQADRPTPHDWRRTMITGLGRLGFRRDDIKALVNHAEGDVTERHYDRYDRLPEKRRALEAWEAHVLILIGERRKPADVVPLSQKKRG